MDSLNNAKSEIRSTLKPQELTTLPVDKPDVDKSVTPTLDDESNCPAVRVPDAKRSINSSVSTSKFSSTENQSNKTVTNIGGIIEQLPEGPFADQSERKSFMDQLEQMVGGRENLNKIKSHLLGEQKTEESAKSSGTTKKLQDKRSDPKVALEKKIIGKIPVMKRVRRHEAVLTVRRQSTHEKGIKNELDRLHEDIDEMFIRNDVLGLNGPRPCTLEKKYLEVNTESDDSSEHDNGKGDAEVWRVENMNPVDTRTVDPLIIQQNATEKTFKIKNNLKRPKYESDDEFTLDDVSHDMNRQRKLKTDAMPTVKKSTPIKETKTLPVKSRFKIPKKVAVETVKSKVQPTSEVVASFEGDFRDFSVISCRLGYIFKCKICKEYETLEKRKFAKHIELEHQFFLWSKHCRLCQGKVENVGNTLLDEFTHLISHMDTKEQTAGPKPGNVKISSVTSLHNLVD